MDLQPRQTLSQQVASAEWLLSKHGTDATLSITLDLSTFVAGTHYVAADGYIPAGTPVKLNGSLYNPSANADTSAAGYLYEPIKVNAGQTRAGAALLWHGAVKTAALNNAFAPGAKPAQVFHA
jgi:hypothetical protein